MSHEHTAGPERLPPQNREAERSVLGSLLRDNNVIPDVIQILQADNFYADAHQKVYKAVLALFDRGHPVDLVVLAEELIKRGELADVGGAPYLAELWEAAPTAANAEFYARIVRERALIRNLIHAGTEILRDSYDQVMAGDELVASAERRIMEIAERGLTGSYSSLTEAVREAFERIDQRTQGHIEAGIPTGFTDLDELTAGLHKNEMVIIAARPSVGKTAMSLNIARHVAVDLHIPVFFVSLEQAKIELAERLLCCQARVDSHRLRKGTLSSEDLDKLIEAANHLREAKLFIDDSPSQSMMRIGANARRLRQREGIRMVMIDYLQLIEPENRRDPRQEQVAQISRRLKQLARDLECPVVALAQVNRSSEDRQDHRPRLADLRESGCLAGDTRVTLAGTGERVRIADLAGRTGFRVWSLDESSLCAKAASVSRAFATGRKPVFRLLTRLGRSIRGTANHKFLSFGGWKRLDELTAGERIAVPRIVPCAGAASIRESEAALLGHLIGDGCTLPRHAVQYTTRERDLAEIVAGLATELFGGLIRPRIAAERQWFQVYLASNQHLTHGVRNPVAGWLDRYKIFGLRSFEKRVPEVIFRQPGPVIATFLKHLWVTDGCILAPRGGGRHPTVYYASSSERLAGDVQELLLRLGINAVLRAYDQGQKGRPQFHVTVMGRADLLRFAEAVGTVGEYKSRELAALVTYLAGREANTNRDVIPKTVWRRLVTPAMQRNRVPMRAMQSALGMSFAGTTLYKANVSRSRLARVAVAVGGDAQLEKLATSDVYWDQILSITPDGEDDVYDLTVPGPANFVADGFFAHNSIEQDADTVFMLHRPDRYEPGAEGVIEVIVAKQRNGPTGEVTLKYTKQFMRYEDFDVGTPFEG